MALEGTLGVPAECDGTVVFAHGSGSGRRSPRNRLVAEVLADAGLSTLLVDLLTEAEEHAEARTGHLRFDIDLLTNRLLPAMEWIGRDPRTHELSLGLFGASTGAAAALKAAARQPEIVQAVVSRGGRPDLALDALATVRAPTLLIVGGEDRAVLDANRQALHELHGTKELEVVLGATHLFEAPGALERVAALARHWFQEHLSAPQSRSGGDQKDRSR